VPYRPLRRIFRMQELGTNFDHYRTSVRGNYPHPLCHRYREISEIKVSRSIALEVKPVTPKGRHVIRSDENAYLGVASAREWLAWQLRNAGA
jgi:hypothetical protein